MAVQPTCCDCRYYQPRPQAADEPYAGYCQIQRVAVHWYATTCNRFRKEKV